MDLEGTARVSTSEAKPGPGFAARVDGWKEIAVYLGRAERTVKRWEADRGLPIHRVPGGGRGSVHAYQNELDLWLKSERNADSESIKSLPPGHQQGLASSNVIETEHSFLRRNRPVLQEWRLMGAFTFAVLTVSLTASWSVRHARAGAGNTPLPTTAAPYKASTKQSGAAHDLYLHGRYEWNQRTPDSLHRAVDSFTQAIVQDPNDAEAYVGLAETYALLPEYSAMTSAEAWPRSQAAAQKAVELDDSLSEAHRALAFAKMYGDWNFVEADKEFRRAIELDPRDPVAHHWYGTALGFPGHFEECLRQLNAAQSLDPGSHTILADKGWMLFLSGRREEGIATLKEVERSVPDFESPHSYLTQIALELGDYPLFLEESQKLVETRRDPILERMFIAARKGYANGGGERGLLQAMYETARSTPTDGASSILLAKVCLLLGRTDEAMEMLNYLYGQHDEYVLACLAHPLFLSLRGDPRYRLLLKKINYPSSPSAKFD